MNMRFNELRSMVLTLPGLTDLSVLDPLFERSTDVVPLDWRFPLFSCRAVGEDVHEILPIVGAMACWRKSITLVDDLLDEDPEGIHESVGTGRAANLALILQAVAGQLIERCHVSAERQLMASATLNRAAIETAIGQELDTKNLSGEENYWALVHAKSTPYYGATFKMGGQLGGASSEVANQLEQFGRYLGEISQIYDDLEDAFKIPAEPDWIQGRNNLVILYGLTAEYKGKSRFLARFKDVGDDSAALAELQQILAQSGAVSYCLYQVLQREEQARKLINETPLVEPEHLLDLFAIIRKQITQIEEQMGIQLSLASTTSE